MAKNSYGGVFFDRSGRRVIKPNGIQAKPRMSCYGICIRGKKVLLIGPSYGKRWGFPGGGKMRGETNLGCLEREVKEETGYNVAKSARIKIKSKKFNFYADDTREYFISRQKFFLMEISGRGKMNHDGGNEISRMAFYSISKLNRKNCHPILLAALRKAISIRGANHLKKQIKKIK